MIDISAQRELSHAIATLLGSVIRSNYHTAGEGIDIGSYRRGTNTDEQPDLDLLFVNIPHDPRHGFVDWTPIDTFSIISTWDGIQDLTFMQQFDPILFNTIMHSLQQLESHGYHARFRGVKAWGGDPGVIIMLSIEHPRHGLLGIDITLFYASEHFGIEHVERFERCIQNIGAKYGEERVQQVLADIRRLKKVVKVASKHQGQLDRKKKISGFVIEALFLHQSEPLSYDAVIAFLDSHTWSIAERMQLPEYIPEQEEPLIGANKTFDDVLRFVTRGGYETLKTVAAQESKHVG